MTALDQAYVIPREVSVYTAGGRHEWHGSSGADYYSESGTFPIFSAIHDRIGNTVPGDSITADPGSPSQPVPTLLERTGTAADRFIDVDVLFDQNGAGRPAGRWAARPAQRYFCRPRPAGRDHPAGHSISRR